MFSNKTSLGTDEEQERNMYDNWVTRKTRFSNRISQDPLRMKIYYRHER